MFLRDVGTFIFTELRNVIQDSVLGMGAVEFSEKCVRLSDYTASHSRKQAFHIRLIFLNL